jgi:hypothetical protein
MPARPPLAPSTLIVLCRAVLAAALSPLRLGNGHNRGSGAAGDGRCPAAEPRTACKNTTEAKIGEASAAIVVEVTQSASVAVPGQPVDEESLVSGALKRLP